MAFDFVDMLVPSQDEYLTGCFYKRRPRVPEDGKVIFKYKQLDPNARVFDRLLGNIRADSARYAIKTNDDCGFNIGGYIVTQNGLTWEITEVITNEEEKGTKNSLRWFATAKNAETSVRMIQVTDLFDKEESYIKDCLVKINITVETNDKVSLIINDDEIINEVGIIGTFIRSETIQVEKGKGVKIEAIVKGIDENNERFEKIRKTFYVSSLQTNKEEFIINYDSTKGA